MTIWKRGSRYWTLVWFHGKRYAKSTGTGNKRQALRIDEQYKGGTHTRSHISEQAPARYDVR